MPCFSLKSLLALAGLFFIFFSFTVAHPADESPTLNDVQDAQCNGGGPEYRVTLALHKGIPKKCKKFPHDKPFKFERDGIDFFNFAPLKFKDIMTSGIPLSPNKWVTALGAHVDQHRETQKSSTAYISVRARSKAQFFRLYSLRFFCLKRGEPVSCNIGSRVSGVSNQDLNALREPITAEYNAGEGAYKFGQLYFNDTEQLRFISLGIPNAEGNDKASDLDKAIPDMDWSNGLTAYVFDIEYSTPKCSRKTSSSGLTKMMDKIATGC